ncbi:sensor histidine kinase [Halobellus sp. EA9]|uniref:sensor histidine kinase n=1 Tax=Halobellus sp. EA9 TaxID=3421647 RepID=UPI003EC0EDAD
MPLSLSGGALYGLYVLAFAAAAVACLWMVPRCRRIEHEETRRGLFWLLVTSGGWAAAHVGYLTMPTPTLQYVFYEVGLVVGLASVGPWLYFCSAYTGRSLHRSTTVRKAFVAVFLLIVAVKVTNPVHHWYFVAEVVETPFAYLQVRHRPLHWLVMGVAYALTAVGFFTLFELFVRVNTDTRPLFVLLALTGIPVVFDVAGAIFPWALDITYSSIGVAAFAVGVFSVYFDRFQYVRVAGEAADPIIVLDEDGEIRDYSARAVDLFPALSEGIDEPLGEVAPGLSAALDDEEPMFEAEIDGETRYFNVSSNPFTTGGAQTGQSIVLTDVTDREQYRRELEAKNEKLEQFASLVSHDLRNPLQVAKGRTELAIDSGDVDHLDAVVRAHERMEQLIEEILTLAREGASIDETERVEISRLAERSWSMIDADGADIVVTEDVECEIEADPERLQQLFENLFRNAIEHGGADVTVTVGCLDDGFYVEDDGPGIPADAREEVFEAGYTTASDGTGFGLAIASEIVEAHSWEIRAVDGTDGGARFEIVGASEIESEVVSAS